ncbi:MAG: hypothetical protein AAGC68_07415 [Verrucomicrobiota bacterium]
MTSRSSSFPSRLLRPSLLAILSGLLCLSSLAEEPPPTIRSQWNFKPHQIELRWDATQRHLQIWQLTKTAIARGPAHLYDLPYEISFHSNLPEASLLLDLGDDGNLTRISTKILEANESNNPKIFLINSRGIIIGKGVTRPLPTE